MKNVDKEDSENEDKFDNFEAKFNFRFEEQGGINITTHTRDQEKLETYREKDDTRIQKRKERDQRVKKEKEEIKKELKKMQEIKKSEIMDKINKLTKVAGTEKIAQLAEELDNEYNPDNFDKIMNKVFNEDFYNTKDKNAVEIVEDIDEKKPDYYTNAKLEFVENEDEEREEEDAENREFNKNDYPDNEEYEENEDDENEWWYCDDCKKVIKPGKIKYDCTTCDDFTLCRDCFKTANHVHKMKKNKVALDAKAPDDWEDIIENLALNCTNCKNEIVDDYYFRCEECGVEKMKVCKACKVDNFHKHHVLKKYKIEYNDGVENVDPKTKIKNIVDNIFDEHYDDIIAKKLPVKFKVN